MHDCQDLSNAKPWHIRPGGDLLARTNGFAFPALFKAKNDTLGHLAGDTVLREVSRRISNALRPGDLVGRFGGEEIVVLLAGTGRGQALIVADRLRRAVAAPLAVEGRDVVQTVSIGLATAPVDGATLDELIGAADKALYRAKAGGRDRVVEARRVEDPTEGAGLRP